MASLNRPTEATYTINERMTVNTSDRMDHTFSGIMFPVLCKELLPVERVVITNIAVRGELGPITIWVSNEPDEVTKTKKVASSAAVAKSSLICQNTSASTHAMKTRSKSRKNCSPKKNTETKRSNHIVANKKQWTQIYSKNHNPSRADYQNFDISQNPIYLKPGQVRGIYVHSTLPNDEAIVYDNYNSRLAIDTPEDSFICIKPGLAHVSPEPFGNRPIWGWGNAWRNDRKFVGKLDYGVVYKLWNPQHHLRFGSEFQRLALLLFACQRRFESPMCRLPDECIFYILNMCKWDWVGDNSEGMSEALEKRNIKLALQQEQKEKAQEDALQAKNEDEEEIHMEDVDLKPSSIPNHEMKDVDEDEDDFEEMEVYEEDDDDMDNWDEYDDDMEETYSYPTLYTESTGNEVEPELLRILGNHHNLRRNRHPDIRDFISAIYSDDASGRIFMLVNSDDDA